MKARMLAALAVGLYALSAGREAQATVVVTTPPLGASTTSTYVCKVVNDQYADLAITLTILDATGGVIASEFIAISNDEAKEVTATGEGDIAYCQVETDTNAHADNLHLNFFVRDSNGNPVGSVSGSRLGLGGTQVRGEGLDTGTSDRLECYAVNTSSNTVYMALYLFANDGALLQTTNGVNLGAHQVVGLGDSGTAVTSGYCGFATGSGADTGRLRMSFFARNGSGDSRSPVQRP